MERWGEKQRRHLFFDYNRMWVMIHFLMRKFLLWTEQNTLLNFNLGKQWNNNKSYKIDIIYGKYVCLFIFYVFLAILSILTILYSISSFTFPGQLRNLFISVGRMCLCACVANSLYLCSFCLCNGLHHRHQELWAWISLRSL